MTLPRESLWFMVNYFNSEIFLGTLFHLERQEFVLRLSSISASPSDAFVSFHSRNRWLYRLVPRFRICRWDSLQRHWCRLSSLHFNEGRRDKGQVRWHKMVNLLGHLCSLLRHWILLTLHHQNYSILLAPEMRFLRLVHGSDRKQWKCRHVHESNSTLFLETSIRFVHRPFVNLSAY